VFYLIDARCNYEDRLKILFAKKKIQVNFSARKKLFALDKKKYSISDLKGRPKLNLSHTVVFCINNVTNNKTEDIYV
jgi:hypothetical protein